MVEYDPATCASRNIHGRNFSDIQKLNMGWEVTPSHFNKVDFSSFLQDKEIKHVEMADATDDVDKDTANPKQTMDNDNPLEVMCMKLLAYC